MYSVVFFAPTRGTIVIFFFAFCPSVNFLSPVLETSLTFPSRIVSEASKRYQIVSNDGEV